MATVWFGLVFHLWFCVLKTFIHDEEEEFILYILYSMLYQERPGCSIFNCAIGEKRLKWCPSPIMPVGIF